MILVHADHVARLLAESQLLLPTFHRRFPATKPGFFYQESSLLGRLLSASLLDGPTLKKVCILFLTLFLTLLKDTTPCGVVDNAIAVDGVLHTIARLFLLLLSRDVFPLS